MHGKSREPRHRLTSVVAGRTPPTGHTFRLFVGSTFSDLKAERDALHTSVFPALTDLCERNGSRFQAIDLRWGVSEEAGIDQRTVPICLEEVARCRAVTPRPNFLLLLGDRYGWRPLPYEIPEAEFEQVIAYVRDPDDRRALQHWYRRDDNAVPATRVLRQRHHRYQNHAVWTNEVELPLRRALEKASLASGLGEDARRKYWASATEQEADAAGLDEPGAQSRAYAYVRSTSGVPNESVDFRDVDEYGRTDEDAQRRLATFKARVGRDLGHRVRNYESRWVGCGISTAHVERLCADVLADLSAAIIDELGRFESQDELQLEQAAHESFAAERRFCFTGCEDSLAAVDRYLSGPADRPLVLYGASGGGKSALIAEAARRAAREHPDQIVVTRFVGATARSTDGAGLLQSVCAEIDHATRSAAPLPADFRLLIQEFVRRLERGRPERPLTIFLDGLDHLASPAYIGELDWLPTPLPSNARMVVSTAGEQLERLRLNNPAIDTVELTRMSSHEGEHLLERWLTAAHRRLEPAQRTAVCAAFAVLGLPLHLKLAYEEARSWHSYDDVVPLAPDVTGIVGTLIERLSADANHGEVIVRAVLSRLLAARHGLTENEILDLLSEDRLVRAAFRSRNPYSQPMAALPVVVWSRLFFDLKPYLIERSADGTQVLGFHHRQAAETIRDEYLRDDALETAHGAMARYFAEQPNWRDTRRQIANERKASELPFQLVRAGRRRAVEATLADLRFIEMKCSAGQTYDLIEDYARLPPALHRDDVTNPPVVEVFRRFVTQHGSIFDRDPSQVWPFAHNYAAGGPVVDRAEHDLDDDGWEAHPWIELVDRPYLVRRPALHARLEGHEGAATAVALCGDGRRAVSGSEDDTLRVWEAQSGICRQIIRVGQQGITSACLSADGSKALTGGNDGSVCAWNLGTGARIKRLEGHQGPVRGVAVAGDDRVVSGGDDGSVRIWDLERGRELACLTGHFGAVHAVAVAGPGPTVVSGGEDRTVRIWDATEEHLDVVLIGHATPVQGVAINGARTVVASCSGQPPDAGGIVTPSLLARSETAFWDMDGGGGPVGTGHEILLRGGNSGIMSSVVHSIALSEDATTAVTGGYDGAVAVWDVLRSEVTARFLGHSDAVLDVALDAAGTRIASASRDGTVCIWNVDGDSPAPLGTRRHVGRIGRGAHSGVEERSKLLWRNLRVRRYVISPLAALTIGFALAATGLGVVDAAWLGDRGSELAKDTGFVGQWFLASVAVAAVIFVIEWRGVLKADAHVWYQPVLPQLLRRAFGLAALPLLPFFRVLDCPLCGRRLAGRRGLLRCADCGFSDAVLRTSREST